MKRLLLIILTFILFSSFSPGAQAATDSGSCSETLTWSYSSATKTLTISGTGELINTGEIWYDYKSEIQIITIGNGVTYIGNNILEDHPALTTVNLPSTLVSYSSGAFDGCPLLSKFTVKSGSSCFSADSAGNLYNADKTTLYICPPARTGSVSLPSSVTTVSDSAFAGCDGVTSITLPSALTTIGDNAFSGCTAISTLSFGASVKSIGTSVFPDSAGFLSITVNSSNAYFSSQNGILYNKAKTTVIRCPGGYTGSYTMPDTVTSMHNGAFLNCDGLTAVSLSANLATVAQTAFYDCDALTAVTFPEGIVTIENSAFRSCDLLADVILPESLTSIGSTAFRDCLCLQHIVIGSKLTTLDTAAFMNCAALEQIALPDTLTTLPANAFYACSSLHTATVGSNVTSIGASCFENCSAITELALPSTLRSIGTRAFYNCDGITELVLPDTLTSLGTYAFYDCDGLINLTIGNGLTSLPERAFSCCYRLRKVDFGTSLTALGYQAFSSCGLISVQLPEQLQKVSKYAFYNCLSLRAVYLPSALTHVYDNAFYYSSVSHVYYGGSETDFAAVSVASGNTRLTDAIWHCEAAADSLKQIFTCCYSHYLCSLCGDTFGFDLLADGAHTYADGVCTVCGLPECLSYSLNTTYGTVEIIGIREGAGVPEILAIPDTIDGCPVISVADNALRGQNTLVHLTLPASLQSIGNYAFYACEKLHAVRFGDELVSIGDSAFGLCGDLRGVRLPDSTLSLGTSAFSGCEYLYWVEFGSGLQSLGDYAFLSCARLVSVHFGGTPTTIGYNAFYGCDRLTHVTHAGSAQDWQSITADSGNTALLSAYRHDACASSPVDFSAVCTGSYAECHLCAKPIRYMDEGGTGHWFENGVCLVCGVAEYLNYTVNETACTVTIDGYDGSVCEVVIPDTIEGFPVSVIAAEAFANDTNLQKITFGNNVTNIGVNALRSCCNLTEVIFGENVRIIGSSAFRDCDALECITLPNSLTEISASAFYDCDALASVLGGSGVQTVGSSAFYDCDALTVFQALPSAERFGSYAFYHCNALTELALPDTLSFIGTYCFSDCDKLAQINFGTGLTTLESYAFYDCDALTAIALPSLLTVLQEHTFSSCDALTYADLGGVRTVNSYVLDECTALKDLHLESAVDILWYAFTGCSALERVYFGNQLSRCDSYAFENCTAVTEMHITDIAVWCAVNVGARFERDLYQSELYLNGEPIVDLVIPEGVTSIGKYAFQYCTSIKTVSLPMSLLTIDRQAFCGCSSLQAVYIPEYVTQLGEFAFSDCVSLTSARGMSGLTVISEGTFSGCTGLVSVSVPYAVTEISECAFLGCENLSYIVLHDGLTTISERAFEDCNRLNHILYEGSANQWKKVTIESGNPILTIVTVHTGCYGGEIIWEEFLGESYLHCTLCGANVTEKPQCFHDEMRLYDEKSPTCTEYGYTGDVWCLICSECVQRGQKIDPLGHSYSGVTTEPTCTENGYTEYTCTVCGDFCIGDTVDPLGHNYSGVATEPKCTENGYTEYTCTVCGDFCIGDTVDPLGHSYSGIIIDPTCTDNGYTDYTCERCADAYRADEIPATGHSYADGICSVCGEADPDYVPPADVPVFTDVPESEWYHDAVDFAVTKGLMNGMGNNRFEPNTTMNRAMLVTVLWRYAGSPIGGENVFTDVPEGQWYTNAVAWAAHNGIVGGVGNSRFDPNGNITREQLAAILYRYCNSCGIDTSNEAVLSSYPDCDKISSYAIHPLAWAVGEGLINGIEHGGRVHLQPQGNATRAQVATILMRFIKNVVQ